MSRAALVKLNLLLYLISSLNFCKWLKIVCVIRFQILEMNLILDELLEARERLITDLLWLVWILLFSGI